MNPNDNHGSKVGSVLQTGQGYYVFLPAPTAGQAIARLKAAGLRMETMGNARGRLHVATRILAALEERAENPCPSPTRN